jgi:hypothetical protein
MARRSLKLLLSYRLSEWLLTNRSSPYSQQVAICRPSARGIRHQLYLLIFHAINPAELSACEPSGTAQTGPWAE